MGEHWWEAMAPPLADLGVNLDVEVIHGGYGAPSYEVSIDGEVLHLYDLDEDQLPSTRDPWTACTRDPARRDQRLLMAAGSEHRLVLMWSGGNDCLSALVRAGTRQELEAHKDDTQLVMPV